MSRDPQVSTGPETMISSSLTGTARFSDYFELTKPRLSLLSIITTLVGYLAVRPDRNLIQLLHVLAGTALAAAGAATLNMWLEVETDARMKRTADRPLPTGKIATGSAFVLGCLLSMIGIGDLYIFVNGISALLAAATVASYVLVYTPAKKWSRWSTEVGAISGALPPLIGWAAAEGRISTLGWILFGILFLWQIPHFMAIAWMHRRDYAAVNFPMLPVLDSEGNAVARWALVNAVLLVICTLLPAVIGFTSIYYGITAALFGAWFCWRAIVFLRKDGRETAARKLFFASIIYLPALLAALVIDRLVA